MQKLQEANILPVHPTAYSAQTSTNITQATCTVDEVSWKNVARRRMGSAPAAGRKHERQAQTFACRRAFFLSDLYRRRALRSAKNNSRTTFDPSDMGLLWLPRCIYHSDRPSDTPPFRCTDSSPRSRTLPAACSHKTPHDWLEGELVEQKAKRSLRFEIPTKIFQLPAGGSVGRRVMYVIG
uniref:Uncharacterized protein n=1 Tax=Anopheles coluzzii TaxID=1518534 RepID=A0A8W7PG91_ANOCL